ncbi:MULTISPECIES: hypothetical protein [Rhizobium]|uniref:hypothetical protein n=1 Tax=Rhizobium TaxID=379 RepID=UPI002ED999F8
MVTSLIAGRLYGQIGLPVVLVAVFLSSMFAPFVFLGNFFVALGGMVLWGVGYATQDTLLKVLIASVLPEGRRNFAFGLFYIGYGVGWLVGCRPRCICRSCAARVPAGLRNGATTEP